MTILEVNSDVCQLRAEEERILASFTGRLIEIASVAGAPGSGTSPTAVLNAMRLAAIALDQHGFVADVNTTADAVFDHNIKIKDRRLFVRDPDARTLLKEAIDQLTAMLPSKPLGYGTDHCSAHGEIARHRSHLALRRAGASSGAGSACSFDAQCLGAKARAARGDPRQNVPPDAFGSESRLHHRTRRSSRHRRPRIEDFPGDGAQSVEIRVCQDGHASPKRTGRTANASRMTD